MGGKKLSLTKHSERAGGNGDDEASSQRVAFCL